MDYIAEQTLKKIGNSQTLLNDKSKSRIYSQFPIPCEQEILGADVVFARKISGIVLTDAGIFIKGNTNASIEISEKGKSKKHDPIYHYIRWEYFDVNDFEVKATDGKSEVYFNETKVLSTSYGSKFFRYYRQEYTDIVKEAAVSAENIFANLEAVIPENFAAVNNKTGHGQMAEEALTLLDKLSGEDASVVGRTNEKNGSDRLVNGVEIQTKYYSTGKGCVDACFDKTTGVFRYIDSKGEVMMIEVPKDKYAEAINEFRTRILDDKVPNVTNPNDASKYIKQGKLTYKQALNLCKPGTIESLTYDSATGAINCSFAFGITFLATFVISYTQTGDKKESMRSALAAGIQVFGLAFFAHMLSQQVARTTLTKQLIPLSTYMVKQIGYKAVQTIVNSIRAMAGKAAISGAAAMKQLAKMLRSNVVTSAITFVAFSVPDTYNFFSKKLSAAQYTKNMLSLLGTMLCAGGGTLAASLAGAKIGAAAGTAITPGVGTAIGIAGGLVGGFAGGTAIKVAGDFIKEDDTIILSRMYNGVVINMIYEYMLQASEIDVLIEKFNSIKPREFKKLFKSVMASDNQEKVISDYVRHYYEVIIRSRPVIKEPTPEDLVELVKELKETD